VTDRELFDICSNKKFKTWQQLAEEIGYRNGDALRQKYRKLELQGFKIDSPDIEHSVSINSDASQISSTLIKMSAEECKDQNFVMKSHGYDPIEWEIVSAKSSVWNQNGNESGMVELYSSRINVKPRKGNISFDEIERHFNEMQSNCKQRDISYMIYPNDGDLYMLEIPIMDLHFGKLGWNKEVGEDYDHKIARDRMIGVVTDIIRRIQPFNVDRIIFPIGQDFFNFDDSIGNTTAGTRQDSDMRWQKMFLEGVDILVECIDMLSMIAPVEVFYVPGNHDKTLSFYATNYIGAWFRNETSVKVNTDPKSRKYVEYGNVLIGFSHGDSEKKRIEGIMQVEARESWGRTLFHEWHLGHLHCESSKENNGIIFRRISSITGTDAWHFESGYIGAIKKAQAFLWHKEYGLVQILNSVIK
jgi:hypothetical protein